jgi:hypothetical protein
MTDNSYELSARDYLLKSAEGEKFEYEELPFADGFDDGPFGDDRYFGVARLNLEMPQDPRPEARALAELGLTGALDDPISNMLKPLKLVFEENEENPISSSSMYTSANMLVVATPRDPRGPFTVSVYQDWSLVGWLGGADIEEFAIHLVEKFDFGCAVVPSDFNFEEIDGEYVLLYHSNRSFFEFQGLRLENSITSPKLSPPSKLTWEYDPQFLELQRNISWDGPGEHLVKVENLDLMKLFTKLDESVSFLNQEVQLVPDVWESGSTAVFAFINDDFVGRFVDSAVEEKFHEALTRVDPHVGLVGRAFLFIDSNDDKPYLSIESDVREIIRIDWDVASEF